VAIIRFRQKKKSAAPKKVAARPTARVVSAPPKVPIAQDQAFTWRPLVQTDETTRKFYTNFAEVNITPYEMVITFATMPARLNVGEIECVTKDENVTIISNVQITLPIGFWPYLLQAMITAGAKHAEQTGATQVNNGTEKTNE
jgi:hypothetical protein